MAVLLALATPFGDYIGESYVAYIKMAKKNMDNEMNHGYEDNMEYFDDMMNKDIFVVYIEAGLYDTNKESYESVEAYEPTFDRLSSEWKILSQDAILYIEDAVLKSKYDGEYIFSFLLENGFECIKDKKERKDKTFTTLISDTGQFYSIEIFFECKNKKHINKVTIYDSLKILNFSVDQIAKDFNLPIRKLKIDYLLKREKDHILTDDEIDYIRNDVEIMARALQIMFDENLTKMTIGSDALNNYKQINKNFIKYFPILPYEIDNDIRKSYKGRVYLFKGY